MNVLERKGWKGVFTHISDRAKFFISFQLIMRGISFGFEFFTHEKDARGIAIYIGPFVLMVGQLRN